MKKKCYTRLENGLTRREFLKKGGGIGAAVGLTSVFSPLAGRASGVERDHILIGHPSPSTGAIAEFGEVSPWVDERAVAAVNAKGGIYIQELDKKLPVKVKVVDTQSDPVNARNVAYDLIVKYKVDMMVAMHTPDVVNPVSQACDSHKMPCVSMVVPLEAWLSSGPYKWCYHAFWSVDSLSNLFLGMWDEYAAQTTKVFGGLWPDDPDGKVWAEIFTKKLHDRGYKVIDPGRFAFFTPDFTDIIDLFKKEKVEIIGGVIIPPDWSNFWRQSRQDGFIPKMAAISKAIPFPSSVNALADNLAGGLISELWWSPNHPFRSSLTGESSQDLCNAWEKDTKKQWTMPLGLTYAGLEIALNAIQRAQSLDKAKIKNVLADTDLDTIVGHIKYDRNHCSETPLVGGQWMKGKRWPWELGIVYNKQHPQIPTSTRLVFPIPS